MRPLNKKWDAPVSIEPVAGELTDHYDPSAKAVRLSEVVYGSTSLAAAAVAAHECGHVIQDVKGYKPMNVRAALVPVANLGSNIAPLLIMVGFGLNAAGGFSTIFLDIGIVLFLGVVLFIKIGFKSTCRMGRSRFTTKNPQS